MSSSSSKQILEQLKTILIPVIAVSVIISLFCIAARSWIPLCPPIVALTLAILTRRIVLSLLTGGLLGTFFAAQGQFFSHLTEDILQPVFSSSWNLTVIAFTILCGGFAAVIFHSGALESLALRIVGKARDSRRFEFSAFILGLICFFDGLANSLIVGRTLRPIAKRFGVTPEKLAYIADSTSAPVACLALATTWVAFQLGVIQQGLDAVEDTGLTVHSQTILIRSIPANFYCWAALLLVPLSIALRWGPLQTGKHSISPDPSDPGFSPEKSNRSVAPWRSLAPILIFVISLLGGIVISGIQVLEKQNRDYAVFEIFGNADIALVLLIAVLISIVAAWACLPTERIMTALHPFLLGCREMIKPVLILAAAWIMGATMKELGTASLLAELLTSNVNPGFLPMLIFILAALIAYTTGTSWGTMGLVIPLAIPLAVDFGGDTNLIVSAVAASLSGAVFGDHTSPFSDTTIVSAAAAGCDPWDHVKTQFPYALTAGIVATLLGFLPIGFGLPGWISLLATIGALLALVWVRLGIRPQESRNSFQK